MLQTITDSHMTEEVKLKIGILSCLATYLLPVTLPKFLELYPNLSINILEDLPKNNELKTLTGEIDYYIGQNPETVSPSLNVQSVGSHLYYDIIQAKSRFYEADQTYLAANSIVLYLFATYSNFKTKELKLKSLIFLPHLFFIDSISKSSIAMNELLAEPLILTKTGSAIQHQIDRLCQRY